MNTRTAPVVLMPGLRAAATGARDIEPGRYQLVYEAGEL
jgi:hypothetical protein